MLIGVFLLMLYYGVVFPIISYGIEVWGAAAECHLKRVFVLQKKAVRIIHKLDPLESCVDSFKNSNLLTVFSLYAFRTILLIKQHTMHNTVNHEVHGHNTRSRMDFHICHSRTVSASKSPFLLGQKMFNSLPPQIKSLNGIPFKKSLKAHLIIKCLYGSP